MKKTRLVVLALMFALLANVLMACTTNEDPTNVTLIITTPDGEYFNQTIELTYEDPTVMMLVQEAAIMYELNIVYNEAGDSVKDIDTFTDHEDEDGWLYYWDYTVNDIVPDPQKGGKADAHVLQDGDVVKYTYNVLNPESVK